MNIVKKIFMNQSFDWLRLEVVTCRIYVIFKDILMITTI